MSEDDAGRLRETVARHAQLTGSPVADDLLADWDVALCRFTAVVPRDYKRVLEATRRAEQDGRPVEEAIMDAARG